MSLCVWQSLYATWDLLGFGGWRICAGESVCNRTDDRDLRSECVTLCRARRSHPTDLPLRRTARRLASRKLTMIVALGSSSTAGAGASSAETTYPSRLMLENGVSYGTVHSVRVGLAQVEVGILARPEGEIRSLLATYQCARSSASMVANPEIIEPALATTADMP
jgi:hypothetical protein